MSELIDNTEKEQEEEKFPVEPRYHPIHKLPRTVYDFALTGTAIPGSPVFDASGSLLGFMMVHRIGVGGGTRTLRALPSGTQEIVIMPATEVAALIDQARQAAAKQRGKPEKSGGDAAQEKKEEKKDTE